MNKKILNSNLLIPMIVFVFLSMSATLVLAGTDNCKIKSGHPDESAEYCPTCEADGIPAKVSCETGPTKGVSGCGCADSWCAKWIENDTCDWSDGVKVCKVVCGDTSDMPICSQVLRNPGAQGLLGITYPSFNLQIIDYLPLGGCPCTSDADCQVNGKYPHRYCQREKFECAELNCNGLLEPRLACCSETGYDCAVDSDCCSLQAVCTNGTCRATQTAICTSTDGPGPSQNPYGDDPFTPGTTSGTTYLMPCVQKDSCSSGKLIEWYCQQNNPNCLSKTIDCNTVCGSGVGECKTDIQGRGYCYCINPTPTTMPTPTRPTGGGGGGGRMLFMTYSLTSVSILAIIVAIAILAIVFYALTKAGKRK